MAKASFLITSAPPTHIELHTGECSPLCLIAHLEFSLPWNAHFSGLCVFAQWISILSLIGAPRSPVFCCPALHWHSPILLHTSRTSIAEVWSLPRVLWMLSLKALVSLYCGWNASRAGLRAPTELYLVYCRSMLPRVSTVSPRWKRKHRLVAAGGTRTSQCPLLPILSVY